MACRACSKNALDWLVSSLEFPEKPVALLNISPNSVHVHAQLREILRTMSAQLIDDEALVIALPRRGLDAAGILADSDLGARFGAAFRAIFEYAERCAFDDPASHK